MSEGSEKVALVTGGASGIGQATALGLSSLGAAVVVVDVDIQGGEETVAKIAAAGGSAIFMRTDVSKSDQVSALLEATRKRYGRLDWAVNNAGTETATALTAECSEMEWHRTIAVNLTGVWLCMKYELPLMLQTGGSIVNVSSVYGLVGCPNGVAYAASKHGINGITRTAALEYASMNIRVNAVCPGGIHTPMIDRLSERSSQFMDTLVAAEPLGRLASPHEVANAITWLCSDAASFMTGVAMPVDGGWTAR